VAPGTPKINKQLFLTNPRQYHSMKPGTEIIRAELAGGGICCFRARCVGVDLRVKAKQHGLVKEQVSKAGSLSCRLFANRNAMAREALVQAYLRPSR